MKITTMAAALVALAAFSPAEAATNLIVNPGFELSQTGWTGTMYFGRAPGYGRNSDGYVSTTCVGEGCVSTYNEGYYATQSIVTTPGSVYNLSFWVAQVIGGPAAFSVFWNGKLVSLVMDPNPNSLTSGVVSSGNYKQFFVNGLIATGALSELQVHGRSDPGSIVFDDFSLTEAGVAAVPEPATWGMLLTGFAAIGGMLRRRRRAVAAA